MNRKILIGKSKHFVNLDDGEYEGHMTCPFFYITDENGKTIASIFTDIKELPRGKNKFMAVVKNNGAEIYFIY